MSGSKKKTNTIIIGGGIAGLYAARQLHQKGIDFVLLEAKSSLGGRILSTASISNNNSALDLGPTWFWPHQSLIRQLISDLGLEWFEQYSQGDVLYQMNQNQPISRHAGAAAMQSFRVVGGMQRIIDKLAEQLDASSIKCQHPVTKVARQAGEWQVTSDAGDNQTVLCAENLIMALPPRQIVKHLTTNEYMSDALSNELNSQQTWMSAQAKFVAEFETAFWRYDELSGQAFSRVGPMVEIHDASASNQNPYALFGFIGIPVAYRSKMGNQQLSESCKDQLIQLFGDKAANPINTYMQDWANDAWVSTKQDKIEQPTHAAFNILKHQQELTDLKLMFVGSEFARNEPGYIEGALEAVKAATDLIQA